MSIKEKIQNCIRKVRSFMEKHNKFFNVLGFVFFAVDILLVLFCFFACFFGCDSERKSYTASADSYVVSAPSSTYSVVTYRNPQLYVNWINSGSYTTLCYSPTLYISSAGYGVSFGRSYYSLSSSETSLLSDTWSTQGQNPISVSGYEVSFVGRVINSNLNADYLYSQLVDGAYVISSVRFSNLVFNTGTNNSSNEFSYEVYVLNTSSSTVSLACRFYFERNETPPVSLSTLNWYSEDSGNSFYYYITYNGLSTSSAEYQAGYDSGRSSGYNLGYEDGYDAGSSTGYNTGYNDGISESLSDITPWGVIVDGIDWFFNIQILPNVRVYMLFSVAFGMLLLGFAIKIFLGG